MVKFMLNNSNALTLSYSPYLDLYDILIPKTNFWRMLKENVDFSFIRDIVGENYTQDYGRTAVDPEFMLKLLLLKAAHELSDRDLIHKATFDLEMKFFLGLDPEETKIIDPSLLSKFRSTRLPQDLVLDDLIKRSVDLALEKGVMSAENVIIVDSTHSNSRFRHISPREELLKRCNAVRKTAYSFDSSLTEQMPSKKKANSGLVEDAVSYCEEVIQAIQNNPQLAQVPAVAERIHYLQEAMDEISVELEYSKEQDARVGHKTADSSFFGFKSHLAMTPERIITAAAITSGENHDGKQLEELIAKSRENGIEVEAVVGDGAYAEKDNLEFTQENGIKLAARLNATVTHGTRREENKFEFNKDTGMYVCPAGHQAIRKARGGQKKAKSGSNTQVETYYFDVERCKHCPLKEGCCKEGAKSKSYSVKIKSDIHLEQMAFMETEEYQELMYERYKIEAKNAELKQNYGYGKASGGGLNSMKLQAAVTIFLSNIQRIFKLSENPWDKCAQNSEKTDLSTE